MRIRPAQPKGAGAGETCPGDSQQRRRWSSQTVAGLSRGKDKSMGCHRAEPIRQVLFEAWSNSGRTEVCVCHLIRTGGSGSATPVEHYLVRTEKRCQRSVAGPAVQGHEQCRRHHVAGAGQTTACKVVQHLQAGFVGFASSVRTAVSVSFLTRYICSRSALPSAAVTAKRRGPLQSAP